MLELWRKRPAEVTLALTLAVCGVGLLFGVAPMEVLGVLLLGLVLTAVNSIKRKDPK
jgi:hypothetical protein